MLSKHSTKGKIEDQYIAEVKGLVGLQVELQTFMKSF